MAGCESESRMEIYVRPNISTQVSRHYRRFAC